MKYTCLLIVCLSWALQQHAAEAQSVSPAFAKAIIRHRDGSQTLGLGDSKGLIDDMAAGDPRGPQAVLETHASFWSQISAVALARIHGDNAGAAIATQRLDAFLSGVRGLHKVELLRLYAEVLGAGNRALAGDMKGWMTSLQTLRQVYEPPVRAALGIPDLAFSDLDIVDLNAPVSAIPDPSVTGPATESVPYIGTRPSGAAAGLYAFVPATIDGQRVQAQIDTGTFISLLPKRVLKAGHFLTIGAVRGMTDGAGRSNDGPLVLASSVTLGQTVLHNVLFHVGGTDTVVLGLQILRQLPHVTLSGAGMTFGSNAPYDCKVPINLSSEPNGGHEGLVFPVLVNHETQYAVFDSGAMVTNLLFATTPRFTPQEQAAARMETAYTAAGRGTFPTISKPVSLTLQSTEMNGQMEKVLKSTSEGLGSLMLTTAVLAHGAVSFDFASRTACFTPKQ